MTGLYSPIKTAALIGGSLTLNLLASSAGLAASLTQIDFSFTGLYQTNPMRGETWYRYNPKAQVTASLVYDPTAADLQLPVLTWLEGRPDWIKDLTVSFPDRQVARTPWGEVPFSTPSTERWLVGQGRLYRVLANPKVALGTFWGISGNTLTYMNALRIFPGQAQIVMGGKALSPATGYSGGPDARLVEDFGSWASSYKTSTIEVADKEAEAVPEPTTILGSIAGLGMLGGMAKRRRALATAGSKD